MRISEQGIALIKRYEGFSAAPYICPAGKPTIGYGHVIREGEDYQDGVTSEQAERLLLDDIGFTEQAVNRLLAVGVTQGQFDALVSFAYNVGMHTFEKSTLLRLINQKDAENAAKQFGRWIYAAGKPLEGLKARRAAETALFTGID